MIAATDRARNILDNAKWGGIGPAFITSLAQEFGLAKLARAWPIVFPIRPAEVPLLFLPEHRDELVERVAAADFVHFWHEIWRQVRIPKMYGPPEGASSIPCSAVSIFAYRLKRVFPQMLSILVP